MDRKSMLTRKKADSTWVQMDPGRFYLGPDVMVPGSSECFSFLSETGSKDFKSDDERGGIGG